MSATPPWEDDDDEELDEDDAPPTPRPVVQRPRQPTPTDDVMMTSGPLPRPGFVRRSSSATVVVGPASLEALTADNVAYALCHLDGRSIGAFACASIAMAAAFSRGPPDRATRSKFGRLWAASIRRGERVCVSAR